jgi:hypothetical protein
MSSRCLVIVALFSAFGCKTAAEPSPAANAEAPAPVASAGARKTFGLPLGEGKAVALAEVLKAPDKFAEQSVLVEGEVRRACTRKGCWMELSEGQGAAPGCRVTFKDYGFFVPIDSAGSKARVEAKVESKVLKPSLVAHMEEEGAQFPVKDPDGSAREVRLVATGVELWR